MSWITVANSLAVSAQMSLPNWVRARGMASYQMAIIGSSALGAALWGQVATSAIRTALFSAAVSGILLMMLAVASSATATRRRPTWAGAARLGRAAVRHAARERTRRHDRRVPRRSAARRRLRRRHAADRRARLSEGAIGWDLLRDIGEPTRFVEEIVDESWTEHLRRFHRATAADIALREPGSPSTKERSRRRSTVTSCAAQRARITRRPECPILNIDRFLLRELVENWAVWRDAGDWERFRTVWHDDGVMMATWFQGPADEFIRVTQRRLGARASASCTSSAAARSISPATARSSQTKMTISQRGDVDGVLCDVVCTGRFYDFIERRDGPLGHRAAPADLREGPRRSGRSVGQARARPGPARRVPEGLSPPRLHPDPDRLHGEARHAAARRARSRGALCARQGVARRRAARSADPETTTSVDQLVPTPSQRSSTVGSAASAVARARVDDAAALEHDAPGA